MNLIVTELEKLSLTLDYINESQAQGILQMINNRVDRLLSPHIIDILWKAEAEDGIILRPLDSVAVDRTERRGAKVFFIRKGSTEQTGIWAWVYENSEPVLIENLRKSMAQVNGFYRILSKPAINMATQKEIDPRYLSIFKDTDSILAVPLITRNAIRGVFSIELPVSGKFTEQRVDFIDKLSKSVARILWKVEVMQHNLKHTSQAINLFGDTILKFKDQEGLSPLRKGFVARPFEENFNMVEEGLNRFLERKRIKAEHYYYTPGRGSVIDDLMNSCNGPEILDSRIAI